MLCLIRVGLLVLVAMSVIPSARADARVDFCFNYGCVSQAAVTFNERELARVRDALRRAGNAVAERGAIARAVATLYRTAGGTTPIAADRAGNLADDGVYGRMDCIDHSTNTTRLLRLLESRGWLRYHRVLEPQRRARIIFQHFSAVIEEMDVAAPADVAAATLADYVPLLLALCDCPMPVAPRASAVGAETPPPAAGARFVVDSWFVDQGEPAVVLPLADWLNGEGPNVQ
ncbi:MAG: hypothetical protein HYS20_12495 [Rhodocyclales bacterium]|nr:hypothetical protein [Rhodocyclales bacterium]